MVSTLSTQQPRRAMILAAGLGTRMRPLTETCPKPLLKVQGKTLLAHCLDQLRMAGVQEIVINTHYLADQIVEFIQHYPQAGLAIHLIHEPILLETGGGVRHALPYFHDDPFYVVNADNLWQPVPEDPLLELAENWQDDSMDALLALVPLPQAHYYDGKGDFILHQDGRLSRYHPANPSDEVWVFSGLQILHPRLFHGVDPGVFSLNKLYDKALASLRLKGCRFPGRWWHVGTPEALEAVNKMVSDA